MQGHEACGWAGDFGTLINSDATQVAAKLAHFLSERGEDQFTAWQASLDILRRAAAGCVAQLAAASDFAAILEYQLPRDDRRPDVIVLENGTVVVIEFKETSGIASADVDQVSSYARDLRNYHSACRTRRVLPFLVPTRYRGPVVARQGVTVTSPDGLGEQLVCLAQGAALSRPDTDAWIRGEYAPLPGITQAARALFLRQPLPRIKRAESARIPDVLALLLDIAAEARRTGSRRLVLLTGVPGSGKTLVGLQLVHSPALVPLAGVADAAPGIFLSGNAPLVQVLQYALRSKDFVQHLQNFLKEYVTRSAAPPPERVIVFDEAQRAWDELHVSAKHKGALGKRSEPELLLGIAERIPGWCVVVALLGEGQEIHKGEEGGLDLWWNALERTADAWFVHAPPAVASRMPGARSAPIEEPLLHLEATLRSHTAVEFHLWVARLLDGRLDEARAIAPSLQGCDVYVTRDLDAAKRYVRRRYAGQGDRRYGLVASSCAENLFIRRLKQERQGVDYGRWYEGKPGQNYCCSLADAVSEFGCQGLEMDFTILCWGDDLSWTEGSWQQRSGKRRRGVSDAGRLRVNAYRVLLTRGRDGTCVFVPADPAALMNGTYEALLAAGAQPLQDP